ncbi:N-alpha-acetyltransferase 40 [Folsomia candida]|uniref:N-alpha-acetyltransferase 40 n=1 Tax=Folsomia candida TaxID=158441 RepID=A0A226EQQ6_FOLCA|nr:N-alpha-acetyltransferase 40 [Folsomia candida]OXA59600.1 N-alpha-acetyltransferase 40 [Folsomia candida]
MIQLNSPTEEDETRVIEANSLEDPLQLELLNNYSSLTYRDGSTATLKHFKAQNLSPVQFKWIMGLMERNMKKMYKRSQGGWKERKKRKEMTQETSRYLVAYVNEKPVAFTHFQFDMDYGRQVLYCYEIQLETTVRRFGLGKHIMKTLEEIATATKLSMVVLTVFKHNLNALAFFKSIRYDIDETCPEDEEEKDYVIMSKRTL